MTIPIYIKSFWRYRKRYAGILLEQMAVFILLALTSVSLTASMKLYLTPGLLNTNNLIGFTYFTNDNVQQARIMATIGEEIADLPYITESSLSVNLLPYLREDSFLYRDSISVDGKAAEVFFKWADTDAEQVLDLELNSGDWITSSKLPDRSIPIVITQKLADTWGLENPVGFQINYSGRTLMIVGVISGLRHNVFGESKNAVILPLNYANVPGNGIEAVARVKKDDKDLFYNDCYRIFSKYGLLDSGRIVVFDMDSLKSTNMADETIPLLLMLLVTIFFMIFALVALYGTTALVLNSRLKEYAIKMSIGATRRKILKDIQSEIVFMTLLACIPGIVLAFFQSEPLSTIIIGVGVAISIMLLASIISTLHPALKIAKMSTNSILKGE